MAVKYSVIASSPSLELSGANVLAASLLERLETRGVAAKWIVSAHHPAGGDADWLGVRRFNIERMPPTRMADVRSRQELLLRRLEENSPCVFLPNFDFDMACVAPALSPANKAALIMHCDDPVYHRFAAGHGKYFNAIICVSEFIAGKLRRALPELRERIVHIPFGVELPARLPDRSPIPGRPLAAAYCGRISFHQKRVQDLAAIINRCHQERVPVKFDIAGTGPDEHAFFELVREAVAAGSVSRKGFLTNADTLKLLERSDVLLLTSEFEGLPVVLLEAMSRGCVPVVTRAESGMGELVRDGQDGCLLPVGDVAGFVATLIKMSAGDGWLQQLQSAAFGRIRTGGFTLERAATDYQSLFESLIRDEGRWPVRRTGKAILPAQYRTGRRIWGRLKNLPGLK